MVDHDVLNRDQDQENHYADNVVAAHQQSFRTLRSPSPRRAVPVFPFSRIKRAEEMFNASRNNVSSNNEVGNTLNSTGRVMYIETSSKITEMVLFALISTSRRNDGIGEIIAITIPSTAKGMVISAIFPNRDAFLTAFTDAGELCFAAFPRWDGGLAGRPTVGAETGPICGVEAISAL